MSSFLSSTPSRSLAAQEADKSLLTITELQKPEKAKPWIVVNVSLVFLIDFDLALNNVLLQMLTPNKIAFQAWIIAEKTCLVVLCCNALFLIFNAVKPVLLSLYAPSFNLTSHQIELLGIPVKQAHLFLKHPTVKTLSDRLRDADSPFFNASLASSPAPSPSSISSLDLSWIFRTRANRSTSGVDITTADVSSSARSRRYGESGQWDFSNLTNVSDALTPSSKEASAVVGLRAETYADAMARLRRARSCSPFIIGGEASRRCVSSQKTLREMLAAKAGKLVNDASLDEDLSPMDRQRRIFSVRSQHGSFFDHSSPRSDSTHFRPCAATSSNSSIINNSLIDPNFSLTSKKTNLLSDSSSLGETSSFTAPRKLDFSRLTGQKYKVSPVVKIDDGLGPVVGGDTETNDEAVAGSMIRPVVSATERAIWLKYDINPDEVDLLAHNCRVWISKTIFKPLVLECELLNSKISEISPNFSIGSSSLNTVREISANLGGQLPSLNLLLPYLELTNDQAFLWSRIKALSEGSCLSAYDPYRNRSVYGSATIYSSPSDATVRNIDSVTKPYRSPSATTLTDRRNLYGTTTDSYKTYSTTPDTCRSLGSASKSVTVEDMSSVPHFSTLFRTADTDLTDFDVVLHCLRVYLTGRLMPNPVRMSGPDFSPYFSFYPQDLPQKLTETTLIIRRMICLYRSNVDLYFYVMGGSNENELILANVLQCFYDSTSQILRKNVEKKNLFDNLDVVMLALDEICDRGIVLETDARAVVQRVVFRPDEYLFSDQSMSQVGSQLLQSAKDQLKWSLLK